jgi:hypothetical protein
LMCADFPHRPVLGVGCTKSNYYLCVSVPFTKRQYLYHID